MTQFNIDPAKGRDAAEELPDEELGRLLQIVVWELAMRTSREEFDSQMRKIATSRADAEEQVALARVAREQQQFIADVMSDIETLPEVGQPSSEPTTGLYL